MVLIQPLRSFCCGFPLESGGRIVLMLHTAQTVFFMVTTVLNIVLEQPSLGAHVALPTQAFNCFYAIAGVPFLISGFSGLKYRIETHLRIYQGFLMFSLFLDAIFVFIFITRTSCSKLPNILQNGGGAFACGVMRIGEVVFIMMMFVFMAYGAFAVWSLCEEIRYGGSPQGFTNLLEAAVGPGVYRTSTGAFVHMKPAGLFGTGAGSEQIPGIYEPRLAKPIVYGSLASPPAGGSEKIFDGKYHDTHYPPAAHRSLY
eukprot:TRINITY_DN27372_c0_g1_i1.p1 TRINITY_DN27372_c0_g1~~TRINITY_DN27372_c0_g1_i1.p1  ORF type:complete len:257 (-),score=52.54 TRINITY_DN27372_c0_g1_i1:74-844(-)